MIDEAKREWKTVHNYSPTMLMMHKLAIIIKLIISVRKKTDIGILKCARDFLNEVIESIENKCKNCSDLRSVPGVKSRYLKDCINCGKIITQSCFYVLSEDGKYANTYINNTHFTQGKFNINLPLFNDSNEGLQQWVNHHVSEKFNVNIYNDWISVGKQLHMKFDGAMNAFKIWDYWSNKSSKYDKQKNISVWNSFSKNVPIEPKCKPAWKVTNNDKPREHEDYCSNCTLPNKDIITVDKLNNCIECGKKITTEYLKNAKSMAQLISEENKVKQNDVDYWIKSPGEKPSLPDDIEVLMRYPINNGGYHYVLGTVGTINWGNPFFTDYQTLKSKTNG